MERPSKLELTIVNLEEQSAPSEEIIASVEKDNLFGTQFHPEKSDSVGLKIIENFINL